MSVLTADLIRRSEENAVTSGAFSFKELMLTAGEAVAKIIDSRYNCQNKKIAVICGNGNNGGDGFVAARWLYEHGATVTVITPMGEPKTENAIYYYNRLGEIKISDTITDDFDIIIDAVFGIGLNRAPSKELIELFKKINSSAAVKIAIDIPSGIEADTGKIFETCVDADLTVTFIALKPCFVLPYGSDFCGEVIVADIGVKPCGESFKTINKPVFPKRRHNSHKGTFGTSLLICGSYGMAGAAILATRAALKSGVGIAKCVLCDGIYSAFTSAVPEAVCIPQKQNSLGTLTEKTDISSLLNGSSALLFGCGVGQSEDTFKILSDIIEKSNIPTVIDADGINLLCSDIELLKKSKAPLILTPHPGEMARLCGCSVKDIETNRIDIAKSFAEECGCILVLKGANTIVALPQGDIYVNINGNPGMATGGSGDVLAGILVSLLAQGFDPAKAALAAVFLHGEAGDKAAMRKGERAMLPSDIIEEL